jgi:Sulfotransferase domain
MILISSSLPKSGSTLVANYQESLIELVAPRNGQARLREVFKGRFIAALTPPVVARLLFIHARYGTLVVKTHSPATPVVRGLISSGVAKASYCYRDPRDVILSAIDHGKRSRAGEDPARAFIEYATIDDSLPRVQALVGRWRGWQRFGKAHFIRYEQLMADKLGSLRAMAAALGWSLSEAQLEAIVAKHQPKRGLSHNFNKGTAYRYRSEMSPEEIARCTAAFKDVLAQYHYEQ